MTLGDFVEAGFDIESPDFYVRPDGKPVKTPEKGTFGVRVTRTDVFDPQYLFYMTEYLHNEGLWNGRKATPAAFRQIPVEKKS